MPVEVKICGLTDQASLDRAIEAGAEYVGLNFYPPSPRSVSIEVAAALAETARGKTRIVALVVDADDDLVHEIAHRVAPDYIQTHGSETPERIAEIQRLTGIPVIKAIKVREQSDIEAAAAFAGVAEMILFDAKAPDDMTNALPGGNGVAFDWSLLTASTTRSRFMLSGGLDPANVTEAVSVTGAPIVDVSSGVEDSPGVKNLDLITKFIEAERAAG